MPRITSGRRYAQAIFEIAEEQGTIEKWQADLERIIAMVRQPNLAALLENPKVPFENKKRFIAQALDEVSPLALNFFYLLIVKGRLGLLDQIAVEFQRLADEALGVARVEVTSPVTLSEEEKRLIADRLSIMTGKQIKLNARVVPAILGGLIIRLDDRVIDGSTRTRLLTLKKELIGTAS